MVAVAVWRGGVLSMMDVDYCRKADVVSIP